MGRACKAAATSRPCRDAKCMVSRGRLVVVLPRLGHELTPGAPCGACVLGQAGRNAEVIALRSGGLPWWRE